jgi:hypothetical protein
MEKAQQSTKMEVSMKVTGKMTCLMETEISYIQMVTLMKENGLTIKTMEKELMFT